MSDDLIELSDRELELILQWAESGVEAMRDEVEEAQDDEDKLDLGNELNIAQSLERRLWGILNHRRASTKVWILVLKATEEAKRDGGMEDEVFLTAYRSPETAQADAKEHSDNELLMSEGESLVWILVKPNLYQGYPEEEKADWFFELMEVEVR